MTQGGAKISQNRVNDGFWLKSANFERSRRICMYTSIKTPYVADYLRGDAHAGLLPQADTKTTETY